MKTLNQLNHLARPAVAALCLAAAVFPPSVWACSGSAGVHCRFDPSICLRSMVLAKAVPRTWVRSENPQVIELPVTLYITCPITNYCGMVCTNPASVATASIAMHLYPGPVPPPLAPLPPPVAFAEISTSAGTMPPPACAPLASGFNTNLVPVNVPANLTEGFYSVVGIATVLFNDGMMLQQRGDAVVCLVDEAPGQPGVPRLELELLTPPIQSAHPGDQRVVTYRLTNNDPSNSVQVAAIGTSKQAATRPQGGNEANGVFAISGSFGDDFPIQFDPGTNCIPLPPHPYTQVEITNLLPTLKPGEFTNVTIGIRSYGQCADGSCSESTLRIEGTFSDGSPAFGAAGSSLFADTSMPAEGCGIGISDCNANGVPDALDIATGVSPDGNFNALPDECEEAIAIPQFAGINPPVVLPGAPVQVGFAIDEAAPISNVWANGVPLLRVQQQPGFSFWQGMIPADQRPGPQTVYFLAKDPTGGLASFIGLYHVENLRLRRISIDSGNDVILEHNGAALGLNVFIEETIDLNLPWVARPGGPHASPHNAGHALESRFFRLSSQTAPGAVNLHSGIEQ